MKPMSTPSPVSLTVYFDGACPVCSREVAAYRRQVGADDCEWIDASSCDDEALGAGLSREAALGRFHVRRADGSLVHGTRGFAALWRVMPRLAWAGRIASMEPLATVLDGAYALFLKLRPLWQTAPRRRTSWIDQAENPREGAGRPTRLYCAEGRDN